MDNQKKMVASASLSLIQPKTVVGIGTGSTVEELIPLLKDHSCTYVSSSKRTSAVMRARGFDIVSANEVSHLDIYIDGTDAVNDDFLLIKGAGGAMTQEKLLASMANVFVVIADESKYHQDFSQVACPIEVIEGARSFCARQIRSMGAIPNYRMGQKTDQGHDILDVYGFSYAEPVALEECLNHMPGVLDSGLFAKRRPDHVLIAKGPQVQHWTR
jgi:ribose 5-phosphate isomerase A